MIKNHWGRGLCGTSHSRGHRQARAGLEASSRPRGPSARPLCPPSPLAPYRLGKAPARRALSVEDVSAPGPARAVGRLVEVFPDGTSQLQLQRPPEGTFGFNVASGNGRRDSGRPPPPCSGSTAPGASAGRSSAFWPWPYLFSGFHRELRELRTQRVSQ